MARFKITAPVPHVVSTIAGVAFADSVGETDSEAAVAYFRRHGYDVEDTQPEDEPALDPEGLEEPDAGKSETPDPPPADPEPEEPKDPASPTKSTGSGRGKAATR